MVAARRRSIVAAQHAHELLDALPDRRGVTLEIDHEAHSERPDEFTAVLGDFLASSAPAYSSRLLGIAVRFARRGAVGPVTT